MKLRLLSLFLLVALFATVGTAAADSPRNFRTHVSGAEAGVQTQAQGQAIFNFSQDGSSLHYKILVANLEDVIGAHIHLAPAGSPGPIVVGFIGTPLLPAEQAITVNGILVEGEVTAADLTGPLAGGTLADLKAAIQDGNTYVNIHTINHPSGEIRGQID
jgi:hypothetical protein